MSNLPDWRASQLRMIEAFLATRGHPRDVSERRSESIGFRLNRLCNAYDELEQLKQPCVWTWEGKFACWTTSCEHGIGPDINPAEHFVFCPWCRRPIAVSGKDGHE